MVEIRDFRPAPVQEWTHNPSDDSPPYVKEGDVCHHELPDGWMADSVPSDGSPRCGAMYPDDPDDPYGSCGAVLGHEHPHMWLRYNYQLISMKRKGAVVHV